MLPEWATRYRNPDVRRRQSLIIGYFFDHIGKTHPSEVVASDLPAWIHDQQQLANNTLRSYMATVRVFMEWAGKQGHCTPLDLADVTEQLRRSYPKTAGKVQDKNPAHRLTYDEAYGELIAACKDGTWRGSRDQLAIRIGLLGIRVAEVTAMNWGHLQDDGTLAWIGKGRKPRQVRAGATLLDQLARWKRKCESELGRPMNGNDPILPNLGNRGQVLWGTRLGVDGYTKLLARRAATADLLPLSPHDLRRTAAKILHESMTEDGAHRFDLADIQQVLGHANADTTQQYLDALDTNAIDRAADVLD